MIWQHCGQFVQLSMSVCNSVQYRPLFSTCFSKQVVAETTLEKLYLYERTLPSLKGKEIVSELLSVLRKGLLDPPSW